MASRTRKLVNRMQWSPRRGSCGLGSAASVSGRTASIVRRIAAMVLELFLIVLDLLLDPLRGQVERVMHVAIPVLGDEFVLVLGVGDDLDGRLAFALAVKVHRHHNRGEAVEKMQQLLRLILKLLVGFIG
jgi:hypothetical protein